VNHTVQRRIRAQRHRQVGYLLERPRDWRQRSERIVFAVALGIVGTVACVGVGAAALAFVRLAWQAFGGGT